MSDFTFDVGNRLSGLGWGWLFFHYVFPVLLGLGLLIALGVGLFLLFRYFMNGVDINKPSPKVYTGIVVGAVIVMLLIVLIIG